jgi:hypothetical protein
MAGTSPPALSKSMFTVLSFQTQSAAKQKPAGAFCASGPMSALFSESLCTPHRARRVAVMVMMAMRPRVHTIKIMKIVLCVNRGF